MSVSREEIKVWATWLRAIGRPETTIGQRTYHLRRVLSDIGRELYELSTQDLIDWLASKSWKPNTRRAYRASLRAFYRWAQATGRRLDDPAIGIPSITVPRGLPRPTPETAYRQSLIDATPRVRRMIRLAAGHGLRRGEIASSRREHVVATVDGHSLIVTGKGGHVRMVPLAPDFAAELLKLPPGWFFPSDSTRDGRAGTHLTPAHVGKLVSRALPDAWTCHTLRHRCGTIAYQLGGRDLRAVQELLGHAKLDTTVLYTQISPDAVREAMAAAAA